MDQHVVPQRAGCGTGKRKAFEGFRDRVIVPAGFPLVPSSLCPRFGALTP